MKRSVLYTILIISVIFMTGCAMLSLPFYGGTTSVIKLSDYCSIAFLDPVTNQPFTSPITLPASVVIKYEYTGHYPANSLNLNVIQKANDKQWLDAANLNPKYATVNFINATDAGDFVISSTMTTIDGHKVNISENLHIVDLTAATITDFRFYITQNATLVPETPNNAFLWMKIKDEESILFSKSVLASFISKSKLYINGRDMTTSGFPPESAIVSDDGKELICIALLNIQETNPVLNAPVILEGKNDMKFVFEGFNVDGSGLIERDLTLSAAYPDTTKPKLTVELYSVDVAMPPLDFSVNDEFFVSITTEDLPDKIGYKPSGLKELKWELYGEGGYTVQESLDISYVNPEGSFETYIPLRMREDGCESGIYNLKISVEDKNGNIIYYGPKSFLYNLTSFINVTLNDEKIAGNMGILGYSAGDSIRLTIDSEESFDSITWSSIPDVGPKLQPNDVIKAADFIDADYGTYEISVIAMKKGIPYIGSKQIDVGATPTYVHKPVIDYTVTDWSNPSMPFEITVKTIKDDPLNEDPEDTLDARVLYYKSGTIEAAIPKISPEGGGSTLEQTFYCRVISPEGDPIIIEDGDSLELTLYAEDAAGNESQKTIIFPYGEGGGNTGGVDKR